MLGALPNEVIAMIVKKCPPEAAFGFANTNQRMMANVQRAGVQQANCHAVRVLTKNETGYMLVIVQVTKHCGTVVEHVLHEKLGSTNEVLRWLLDGGIVCCRITLVLMTVDDQTMEILSKVAKRYHVIDIDN